MLCDILLLIAAMLRVNIGCPIWTHDAWFSSIYPPKSSNRTALQSYSGLFNSVECNSSFYHLPNQDTLKKWRDSVPDDFRFVLKLPRSISHSGQLDACTDELKHTIDNLSLLGETLGGVMLQLPKQFTPSHINQLEVLLDTIPTDLPMSVEVRQSAFFQKGEHEKLLNQLLLSHKADRVIMDTRALFACEPSQYTGDERELVIDVQRKKPRVPTNVIATGDTPVVRFVGHQQIDKCASFYRPWINKIKHWLDEGKSPSIFFHMPDNKDAPWLAAAFIHDYNLTYPDAPLPALVLSASQNSHQQISIFDSLSP
ncbi:hypothetical protein GMES_3191 [Paraglaciecola mesophila KMM 241]|uniref:DUF72 domain-containing protein n=2 Tax=Paraglaciecola mesophila TaxID=197222 RepID=K6XXZ6_9ALTE|nr:hypothetical protein GMES_3191 [Paraglaciecola mesophila KMM 241]